MIYQVFIIVRNEARTEIYDILAETKITGKKACSWLGIPDPGMPVYAMVFLPQNNLVLIII